MSSSTKTKELNELKKGDKLKRISDNEIYEVGDILNECEENSLSKKTYFYFKNFGNIRDRLMRAMFITDLNGFKIYD